VVWVRCSRGRCGPLLDFAICFVEVAGIGVSCQYHVACGVCGAVVGVGGDVVEELVDACGGVMCGGGLLGADGAEGAKELWVDGPGIVEEGAHDALDSLDAGFGEGWACVDVGGLVLGFGTVDDGSVPVWRMLR